MLLVSGWKAFFDREGSRRLPGLLQQHMHITKRYKQATGLNPAELVSGQAAQSKPSNKAPARPSRDGLATSVAGLGAHAERGGGGGRELKVVMTMRATSMQVLEVQGDLS